MVNEYSIKSDELLTRVTKYELSRADSHLRIDVHEIIAGEDAGSFLAIPNLIIGRTEEKYIGRGSSIEEALKDCLSRIQGVSSETIIPKSPIT